MNKEPVKVLGLTVDQLTNLGLATYATKNEDLVLEAYKQNLPDSQQLADARAIAGEEAMIHTFAAMIEENNQVWLKPLKQLGVLPDSID